jgi:hypothetical protein
VHWRLRRIAKRAGQRLARLGAAPTPSSEDLVGQYLAGGRIPWSPGYAVYRNRELERVVQDEPLLARFRDGRPLPPAYGLGLDERIVEYPWVIAHLPAGPGR